jgi:hypothetical protein
LMRDSTRGYFFLMFCWFEEGRGARARHSTCHSTAQRGLLTQCSLQCMLPLYQA